MPNNRVAGSALSSCSVARDEGHNPGGETGVRGFGFHCGRRLLTVFGRSWEEFEGGDRIYSTACRLAMAGVIGQQRT